MIAGPFHTFRGLRSKFADTFAVPKQCAPESCVGLVAPIKRIVAEASRVEEIAKLTRGQSEFQERSHLQKMRVPTNHGNEMYIFPFRPCMIITEWINNFEWFIEISNVRDDVDKA